nr:hypothetical protein Q903MT_gene3671 [Picea sitchensis]
MNIHPHWLFPHPLGVAHAKTHPPDLPGQQCEFYQAYWGCNEVDVTKVNINNRVRD